MLPDLYPCRAFLTLMTLGVTINQTNGVIYRLCVNFARQIANCGVYIYIYIHMIYIFYVVK